MGERSSAESARLAAKDLRESVTNPFSNALVKTRCRSAVPDLFDKPFGSRHSILQTGIIRSLLTIGQSGHVELVSHVPDRVVLNEIILPGALLDNQLGRQCIVIDLNAPQDTLAHAENLIVQDEFLVRDGQVRFHQAG